MSWSNAVLTSRVDTTYNHTTVPGKGTKFIFLDESESWNYDLNSGGEQVRYVTRDFTHNATYGNLETDTTHVYGGPAGGEVLLQTSLTELDYFPADQTDWQINQIENTTTTVDDGPGGEASIQRKVAFTYAPGFTGELKTVTRQPDATDETKLKTTFVYDVFGNVTEQHVQGFGAEAETRVSKIGYGIGTGADGRLPQSTENALEHESSLTYHPVCDAPALITDANSNQAEITYDDFCRQETVTDPTGIVSATTYTTAANIGTCSNCQVAPSFKITQSTTGSAAIDTYLNRYLQPMLTSTLDMALNTVEQKTDYDRFGRVDKSSQPYFEGDTPLYNDNKYDVLDRLTETQLPYLTESGTQAKVTHGYYVANAAGVPNALRRATTDPEGRTSFAFSNALGQIKQVLDAYSKSLNYHYYSDGSLKSTVDDAGNTIVVSYDDIGRRTQLNDPDMGVASYTYSSFGEMLTHTDDKGFIKSMKYDKLGRLTERFVPTIPGDPTSSGDTSYWYYDTPQSNTLGYNTQKTVGLPTLVTGPNNYAQSLYYDEYGRPVASTTTIKGVPLTQHVSYNASNGLIASRTFPESGAGNPFAVQYKYLNGYLEQITSTEDQFGNCVKHWQVDEYDALGRVKLETLGNLVQTARAFKPGQNVLDSIQSTLMQGAGGVVQNLAYTYDGVNNVKTRHDSLNNLFEEFDYDNLDRLTSHTKTHNAVTSEVTVAYDAIGNITYKSDVGTYTYGQGGAGPHAVTSIAPINPSPDWSHFQVNWEWDGEAELKNLPNYQTNQTSPYDGVFKYDANGSVEEIGNRNVYWTAFDKPYLMIATTASGMQGSLIEYDAQQNRVYKEEATFSSLGVKTAVTEKTLYLGKEYERIEKFKDGVSQGIVHRYMIATAGNVIQIEREDGTGFDKPKYLLGDNLGSTNVILNALGEVEQRLAFDPWGMRMNVGDVGAVNKLTNRGYTGHEMDDEVGLINMNARIYDPLLGRFLSADPLVPDAGNLQSFNRYSYVRNNPLKYIDPTGHKDEITVTGYRPYGGSAAGGGHGSGRNGNNPSDTAAGRGAGAQGSNGQTTSGEATDGANDSGADDGSGSTGDGGSTIETITVLGQRISSLQTALGHMGHLSSPMARGMQSRLDFLIDQLEKIIDRLDDLQHAGGHSPVEGTYTDQNGQQVDLEVNDTGAEVIPGSTNSLYDPNSGTFYEYDWRTGTVTAVGTVTPLESVCPSCYLIGVTALIRGGVGLLTRQGGSHFVYVGIDPITGIIKYVGITGRSVAVRAGEHASSSSARAFLQYSAVRRGSNLSLRAARIMEQNLINRYGLMRNGGTLLNRINSIAPSRWAEFGIKALR